MNIHQPVVQIVTAAHDERTGTDRPIELHIPLNAIMHYQAVYALCTLSKMTKRLKATHFTTCLVHGREPIWGVWSVNGVFQRFYARKSGVEEAYPKLVWRRKQATWHLVDVHDKTVEERVRELDEIYRPGRRAAPMIEHDPKERLA